MKIIDPIGSAGTILPVGTRNDLIPNKNEVREVKTPTKIIGNTIKIINDVNIFFILLNITLSINY